jgi:hypothetical protein
LRHRVCRGWDRRRALLAVATGGAAACLLPAPLQPLAPLCALAALEPLPPIIRAIRRRGLPELDRLDPRRLGGAQEQGHRTDRPRARQETAHDEHSQKGAHRAALIGEISKGVLTVNPLCNGHSPITLRGGGEDTMSLT